MNFSGKAGHPNIQPSTRLRIKLGTSGLAGKDLNHCANPSTVVVATVQDYTLPQETKHKTYGKDGLGQFEIDWGKAGEGLVQSISYFPLPPGSQKPNGHTLTGDLGHLHDFV